MFYDRFKALCDNRKISCKKAAEDIGLSNSITTKWKKTGATPQGDTLQKIAEYFEVTIDYLLGNEKEPATLEGGELEDTLKFALFGGEASDAQFEEVKRFAQFIKERDKGDNR